MSPSIKTQNQEYRALICQKGQTFEIQRSFVGQIVCGITLNEIVNRSFDILDRKQKIRRLIEQQTFQQSQQFTIKNCGQVLHNYFSQACYLPPEIKEQENVVSPLKPENSFLKYQQLRQDSGRDQMLSMKRQEWQRRRGSINVYNCNKLYILKKSVLKKQSPEQKDSTLKSIRMNDSSYNGSSFSGRYSHKPEMKKISIKNNMIARLSTRGRLTANLFNPPKNKEGNQQSDVIRSLNRKYTNGDSSSFYQQNKSPIQHSLFRRNKQKLIKLEQTQRTAPHKTIKLQLDQKQTDNHITYLRERKQKMQIVMKHFDLDEIVKKNNDLERELLVRDNKTPNLPQTYSKTPTFTTDYQGNLIYLKQKNTNRKGNHKNNSNQKTYTNLPKFQCNLQGSQSQNIPFKIKDIDDKTKNFINQIFSSSRTTPSKSTKKIMLNTHNLKAKEANQKGSRNQTQRKRTDSTIFFIQSEDKTQYENLGPQPLVGTQGYFKSSKISNENRNEGKNLKPVLKTSINYHRNNLKQRERQSIQQKSSQFGMSTTKSSLSELQQSKGKGILKSQPSHRDAKKGKQNSITQVQKLYRQQYNMRKQRIHPNHSKNKKSLRPNTDQKQVNQILQVSNQNSQRNSVNGKEQIRGFQTLVSISPSNDI